MKAWTFLIIRSVEGRVILGNSRETHHANNGLASTASEARLLPGVPLTRWETNKI